MCVTCGVSFPNKHGQTREKEEEEEKTINRFTYRYTQTIKSSLRRLIYFDIIPFCFISFILFNSRLEKNKEKVSFKEEENNEAIRAWEKRQVRQVAGEQSYRVLMS